MVMQPIIREATASDAAPAQRCVASAFHRYIERIGQEPAPMLLDFSAQVEARHVWVAEVNAAVVGVLVQYETEAGFYIDTAAVLPECQGTGVGRALLLFAEQEAIRRNFDSLFLCTNSKMTENQILYLRVGYVEFDRQVLGGFDRVFYRKQLHAPGATMELVVDHVMFPVYYNNPFLDLVEEIWKERRLGTVFAGPQNSSFKGVYLQSKSFYVEYLSNTKSEPYWSNAVYVVVPKKYWEYYTAPALLSEYFLVPKFGCGHSIISPDYPNLTEVIARDEHYDGLAVLISRTLEKELLQIAGQKWVLPQSGKIRVHDRLTHVHDIVVIDEKSRLVAPLLQANPLMRELLP